MVFNATFNNITVISWQFVHKGDRIRERPFNLKGGGVMVFF
jgi:hypothetical protein